MSSARAPAPASEKGQEPMVAESTVSRPPDREDWSDCGDRPPAIDHVPAQRVAETSQGRRVRSSVIHSLTLDVGPFPIVFAPGGAAQPLHARDEQRAGGEE